MINDNIRLYDVFNGDHIERDDEAVTLLDRKGYDDNHGALEALWDYLLDVREETNRRSRAAGAEDRDHLLACALTTLVTNLPGFDDMGTEAAHSAIGEVMSQWLNSDTGETGGINLQERDMPDVLNGETAKVLANMMKRHLPRFAEVEVVPHQYRNNSDYSNVIETHRLHVYYPLGELDLIARVESLEYHCVYTFDLREGVQVERPNRFVPEYQEEASRLNKWHDDVVRIMFARNN